jgi:putative heme-binding domain-containing protein
LYVVDYYRQLIEHPEWMSEEVNKSGALYNGSTKGRIYRVTKKGSDPMDWMKSVRLSEKSSDELVKLLSHENGWFRKTAQRLLFQRGDKKVASALSDLVQSDSEYGPVAAMWLLHDWGILNPKDLENALKSSSEGVRENALQLADRMMQNPGFKGNSALNESIIKLADDPSARVRFQWICSSSYLSLPKMAELKAKILTKDIDDHWTGIAAIASSQGAEYDLLKFSTQAMGPTASEGKSEFLGYLAATLVKKGDTEFLNLAIDNNPKNDWWQAAILKGVSAYVNETHADFRLSEAQKDLMARTFYSTENNELRGSIIRIFGISGLPKNKSIITEGGKKASVSSNKELQASSLKLTALAKNPAVEAQLVSLLSQKNPEHLQVAAITSLPKILKSKDLIAINRAYSSMAPKAKKEWIKYMLFNDKYITNLLKEVEKNNIPKTDLAWPQFVELMNYYDKGVRALARKVLAIAEDRKAILQNYLPAVEMAGNAEKGKKVFEANCTTCHIIKDVKGIEFGPNLSTLKSRNALSIVTEIINPNNSIADKYGQWEVEKTDGTRLTGIITSENNQSIALKLMGGTVQNIEKTRIKSKRDMRVSAMPNGLEGNINLKAMADLLAYIKK